MNRWKGALAVVAAAALLASCSGGDDPSPTAQPTTPASGATTTEAPSDATFPGSCEPGDLSDADYTVEFGEMGAAQDEWAGGLDRTWRHFLPFTFTNTMDVGCTFVVTFDLAVDGEAGKATDGFSVPLKAGQSFHGQMFDLDGPLGLEDAESASTSATLTASVSEVGGTRYFGDYYDLSFEVGERDGVGSATTVPVTVTTTAVAAGMPERLFTAYQDLYWLLGLDGDGDVITVARNTQDALTVPGETTIWFALAGGGSSGFSRELMPMSTYDDVTSWTFVAKPQFTELDK